MPRYQDANDLAGDVGGMYALVVAVAKRAKQLREGRQPVVESDSGNMLTIAIKELVEGKVIVRPPGVPEEEPGPETEVVEVMAHDLQDEAEEDSEDEEEEQAEE